MYGRLVTQFIWQSLLCHKFALWEAKWKRHTDTKCTLPSWFSVALLSQTFFVLCFCVITNVSNEMCNDSNVGSSCRWGTGRKSLSRNSWAATAPSLPDALRCQTFLLTLVNKKKLPRRVRWAHHQPSLPDTLLWCTIMMHAHCTKACLTASLLSNQFRSVTLKNSASGDVSEILIKCDQLSRPSPPAAPSPHVGAGVERNSPYQVLAEPGSLTH